MAKSWGWQWMWSMHSFIGDVLVAFHFMAPDIVSETLSERRLAGRVSAALIAEGQYLLLEPRFEAIIQHIQVALSRCERTDSVDASPKWNWTMEWCVWL